MNCGWELTDDYGHLRAARDRAHPGLPRCRSRSRPAGSPSIPVLFADDGGTGLQAGIRLRLLAGRRSVVRLRPNWADATGRSAGMYW